MYADMRGQKVKTPMDIGAMMDQALASASAFDVSEELLDHLNLWAEGENTVIGYTISDAKMNDYIQMVLGSTGLTGMTD